MKKFILPFLLLVPTSILAGESPELILKKADRIRNPAQSYLIEVEVKDSDSEEPSVYEVSIEGSDKTFVRTLKPVRDKDKNMLMLGQEMWVSMPSLKRSVRVSLSQKLQGEAANGDISRMTWSGDYSPKIESQTPKAWVLFLTAKKQGLTYDKIRVWIEKNTFHPLKSEFLTKSGKVLRQATYRNYQPLLGVVRPREIHIVNATNEKLFSTIRILDMKVKRFPASLFAQSNLK